MKVKIFTAPTEIDASIIKGALENVDIPVSIAPGVGSLTLQARSRGPNVSHDVFVEDKDSQKALGVIEDMHLGTTTN